MHFTCIVREHQLWPCGPFPCRWSCLEDPHRWGHQQGRPSTRLRQMGGHFQRVGLDRVTVWEVANLDPKVFRCVVGVATHCVPMRAPHPDLKSIWKRVDWKRGRNIYEIVALQPEAKGVEGRCWDNKMGFIQNKQEQGNKSNFGSQKQRMLVLDHTSGLMLTTGLGNTQIHKQGSKQEPAGSD